MASAQVILYVAVTADGFIADRNGGVDWLHGYNPADYGAAEFMASVSTLVMGRITYEQALAMGGWPYGDARVVVLSSRDNMELLHGAERFSGDVHELAAFVGRLRRESTRNIWLMGGGLAVRSMLDADTVDEIDLYVIPMLLGGGVPLFPERSERLPLRLVETCATPRGVVRLRYAVER